MEGAIWAVTEQIVEQALESMKIGKAPGPSGVTSDLISDLIKAALNRKARFQSSGTSVLPYC